MKIRLQLISVLLFITFFDASAQSKLSFGLGFRNLKNDRIISKSSSDRYMNYRNENESSISGIDAEVTIIYKFKANYNFETGVGFVQKGYKINEDYIIDPCYSPVTCGYAADLYRYANDYLSIPLHLNYMSSKRIFFSYNAGISLLIPISSEVEYIVRKERGEKTDQVIYKQKNSSDYSPIDISLDLAVGVGYRFSERIRCILQPKFAYNLLPNENTHIRDRQYNIGLFDNENKSTKEHFVSYGAGIKVIYDLK